MQKSFDSTFGNYLLHGIDEVFLPETVSWWPHTWGWKILAVLCLLWLGRLLYRQLLRWRRNRYRRLALRVLDQLQENADAAPHILRQLPELLKATALQAYPRPAVAGLTGNAWLQMLDSVCPQSNFDSPLGQQMLAISYQDPAQWSLNTDQIPELLAMCRLWISKHKADAPMADDD